MASVLDRRAILLGAAASAGALATPSFAAANSEVREAEFFRKAVVINGNLVPPLDDTNRLPDEEVARFRASGLTAMKVSMGGSGSNYADTLDEMAAYDRAIALMPDLFIQIRSVADIDLAKRTDRIGVIYSFESVEMHEGKPERVTEFAGKGVKVMQLSYNLPSKWASGVMSPLPSQGLTPLGREAVAAMNAGKVAIDIAHADEKSSLDVMAASTRPVSVTHAGCKAIHDNPRNKSDAILKKLADQGGVIGIFELSYLNGGATQPTLDDYMAHMTHALKVAGEDHVGIGSDALLTAFDTTPENLAQWAAETKRRKEAGIAAPGEGPPPFVEGLNRPDRAAVIAHELRRRGHRDRTIEKVLGLNFRRWFNEAWT
jgi:membrane dipeptidase